MKISYNNLFNGFSKNALLILAFTVISFFSIAQSISSYSFSSFIGSTTDINGLGTQLGTGMQDDISYNVTFPFTFMYHGNAFTSAGINDNGFIVLGGSSSTFYTPLSSVANAISAFGGDLYGSFASHRLEYLTSGTSPNRVMRIQWSNWDYYPNATNEFTFQICLFETSNMIQFYYLAMPGNSSHTVQVGLTGAAVSDFNIRKVTTNWSASIVGNNASTFTYSSTVKPATNLCYQWNGGAGCSTSFTLTPDTALAHHYWISPTVTGVAPFTYTWFWGDSTSDSVAYPSHIYADSGFYTICLKISDATGCESIFCDSSYHIMRTQNTFEYVNVLDPNITTGSMNNATYSPKINIFPNPAKSTLNIQYNATAQLSIMDILGNRILYQNLKAGNTTLDVSKFAKGIYTLQIKNDMESVVRKIVID